MPLLAVQFVIMLCAIFISGYHFGKGNDILGWVVAAMALVLFFRVAVGVFTRWRA